MDGKEFTGWSGIQEVSVVHAKPVCYPVKVVTGQLRQFIGAIGGGGKGFLELVIG
jgi:hypothetical protein